MLAALDHFGSLTEDLTHEELDRTTEPGGWTIRQVIHHLADDGDVWNLALKIAISTPGQRFGLNPYPGNDEWSRLLKYNQRDVGPALLQLLAQRRIMVQLAESFPESWQNTVTAVSLEGKELHTFTVESIIRMSLDHLKEHTNVIETTLNSD